MQVNWWNKQKKLCKCSNFYLTTYLHNSYSNKAKPPTSTYHFRTKCPQNNVILQKLLFPASPTPTPPPVPQLPQFPLNFPKPKLTTFIVPPARRPVWLKSWGRWGRCFITSICCIRACMWWPRMSRGWLIWLWWWVWCWVWIKFMSLSRNFFEKLIAICREDEENICQ